MSSLGKLRMSLLTKQNFLETLAFKFSKGIASGFKQYLLTVIHAAFHCCLIPHSNVSAADNIQYRVYI